MKDIAWTWFGIRASGITAWVLLTAVVAYGFFLRTRVLRNVKAPLVLLETHRWLGAAALLFLAGHLILLTIDPYVTFTVPQLFIPFLTDWKPAAVAFGIAAMWVMIPVAIIGRLRAKMGKAGNTWFKHAHRVSYAAWPLATAHYVLAGTDAMAWWSLILLAAASLFLLFLLLTRGFVPRWQPERGKPADRTRTPSSL